MLKELVSLLVQAQATVTEDGVHGDADFQELLGTPVSFTELCVNTGDRIAAASFIKQLQNERRPSKIHLTLRTKSAAELVRMQV